MLTEVTGSFSLVLERPFSPFPIHKLHQLSDLDILFNRGRMPVATWNKALLASNLQTTEGGGNSGFVVFSSKFLASPGLKFLNDQNGHVGSGLQKNTLSSPVSQLVCIFSEKEPGDGEWAHGSFPLEEYIKALERSKGELYYNHSLGMRYSKVQCTSLQCLIAFWSNKFYWPSHNTLLSRTQFLFSPLVFINFLLNHHSLYLDYRADLCGVMYTDRCWCQNSVWCGECIETCYLSRIISCHMSDIRVFFLPTSWSMMLSFWDWFCWLISYIFC